MTGLERLKAGIGNPALRANMATTLGFRVAQAEEGTVVIHADPEPGFLNMSGIVHGGWAATLLDSAMGCAAQSTVGDGQSVTTVEIKVAYHRPIKVDTGTVIVTGRILNRSRRLAFAEGRLEDARGRLLASGTSTLMVLDPR